MNLTIKKPAPTRDHGTACPTCRGTGTQSSNSVSSSGHYQQVFEECETCRGTGNKP